MEEWDVLEWWGCTVKENTWALIYVMILKKQIIIASNSKLVEQVFICHVDVYL